VGLSLRIRHVLAGESGPLRDIRLRSLAADPDAFGATHAHESGLPLRWFEEWAARSGDGSEQRTFVLVDDADAWLGLALARSDEPDSRGAVINAMWVAPGARGMGGARLLCDACVAWATEHGFPEIALDVFVGNDRARRIYEAAGFAIRSEEMRTQHGRTLHDYVMVRPLTDEPG
jgi:ribosomal protein S18 acetylase RimI-like enzyme